MTAFDTDVLSDIFDGRPDYLLRLAAIPPALQAAPVVVMDEMLRGRLDMIRQADAGRAAVTVARAYELLDQTVAAFRAVRILPFTDAADVLVRGWKRAKIRVGTNDMRIAAIAISHQATLASRNARDFSLIPGLMLDVWP